MIIIELILNLYTAVVLGTTSIIEIITGLYPAQQLAYVKKVHTLPDTAGVADTIIGAMK